MPLPSVPKSLHRLQMERLSYHIQSDPVLKTIFYKITLKPQLAPENNPAFSPTLAIYVVRENVSFATTETHARPALFTMALLYPEAKCETVGITSDDIYANLLDVVELLLEKLYAIRVDPADLTHNGRRLWHSLLMGGSQKPSRENSIQVAPYSAGYEREAGVKQVGLINFALFGNLDNDADNDEEDEE